MSSLPLDIAGKVLLSLIDLCDELRPWAEDSRVRTVYTWYMVQHRRLDMARCQSGQWPLIRAILGIFSLPRFHWHGRTARSAGQFLRHSEWSTTMAPAGAVRGQWDGRKHGGLVFLHLASAPGRAAAADWNRTLHVAALSGFTAAVAHLLPLMMNENADFAEQSSVALCLAAKKGHASIVELLVGLPRELGVDPATNNNAPLRSAAWEGHVPVVRILLDLPLDRLVDPAANGNDPLRFAAEKGHEDIVALLLAAPAGRQVDPGANDSEALRVAAKMGHVGVVQRLLDLACRQTVLEDILANGEPTQAVRDLFNAHLARR